MAGLTDKQQRFVQEYILDWNATQAAIRAGYSKRTARVVGPENLSKPAVRDAIETERQKIAQQVTVTREEVIRGLAREAYNEEARSSDRITAWSWLGRMHAMFTDKTQVDVPGGIRFELTDDADSD